MTILITGATGTVGRALASELSRAGAPVRALVTDAGRGRDLLPEGVELAVGDFADADSLAAAVRGVRQVFLAAPNHPDQAAWEVAMIDAGRAAGVRRVVKLSAHGARRGSPVAFWDAHARSEDHLASSGLDAVVLRPTTYATNLLASWDAVENGILPAPAAGARVSFIDPADVAAAAAAVLTGRSAARGVLTLTGPAAIGFDDAAACLARLLDRPVGFVPLGDDEALGALVGAGASPWFAANLVRVFGALRAGLADLTTPTVSGLVGRPPASLWRALRPHVARRMTQSGSASSSAVIRQAEPARA